MSDETTDTTAPEETTQEDSCEETAAPNPPYGVKEGPGHLITFETQAEFDVHILGLAATISQDAKRFLAARSR